MIGGRREDRGQALWKRGIQSWKMSRLSWVYLCKTKLSAGVKNLGNNTHLLPGFVKITQGKLPLLGNFC